MKQKLFAKVALFLILFSGVFSPLVNTFVPYSAFAQEPGPQPAPPNYVTPTGATPPVPQEQQTTSSDALDENSSQEAIAGTSNDICNGLLDFGCQLAQLLSTIMMYIPTILATISGMVMDMSIWYSLKSDTYTAYDGTPGEEGLVVTGWKLVRDFTNILFIFALFAVGFGLILNVTYLGLEPKKTVARVIVMALLINFSFFLSRVVVDISNTLALGFYNRMTAAPSFEQNLQSFNQGNQDALGDPRKFYENSPGIRSLSSAIISKANPQSLVLLSKTYTDWDLSTVVLYLFTSFMAAVFNLFLVYIFLSIAILFVARVIGIYLAVILSPIAFVSRTIPQLEKKQYIGFDDWLKEFTGISFMAPIFLFFIYIAVQFLQIPMLSVDQGGDINLLASTAAILFKFLIVGAFLIFAKRVAKDMSGRIGEMTVNAVSSVATTGAMLAGAAATGGASAALQMGRRMATDKIKSTAISAGNKMIGEEKTAAIQQRFGAFTYSPRSAMAATRKVFGENDISRAYRTGYVSNRALDFENARKAKAELDKKKAEENKKKIKPIDDKIKQLEKDLADGIINKKEFEEARKPLAQQKREILEPNPTRAESANMKSAKTQEAQLKRERSDADFESKITATKNKIVELDTKIATQQPLVANAEKAVLDAERDRTQADNNVLAKNAELIKATKDDADLANQLAQLEQEYSNLPKGFLREEDRAKKADLEQRKNDIVSSRNLIASNIAKMSGDLQNLKNIQSTAITNEASAKNHRDSTLATFNDLTNQKTTASQTVQDLETAQSKLDADIATAEASTAHAEQTLKNKNEEVSISQELEMRELTQNKNDTDNQKRNDQAIETLRNRLSAITNGGTATGGTGPTGGSTPPPGGGTPPTGTTPPVPPSGATGGMPTTP